MPQSTSGEKRVMIPQVLIVFGQGIEFDYCCVLLPTLRGQGYETVMRGSAQPSSTVMTPPDRLYFQPAAFENVMDGEVEKPESLSPWWPDSIELARSQRGRWCSYHRYSARQLTWQRTATTTSTSERLNIACPPSAVASTMDGPVTQLAVLAAIRPSYVLGGRGMAIVYDDSDLVTYMESLTHVTPDRPVYPGPSSRTLLSWTLTLCDTGSAMWARSGAHRGVRYSLW